MKILEINKFYHLRGGSERHLFELSDALTRRGHSVIPFSMKNERNQPNGFSNYFVDSVDLDSINFRNILKIFYNWQAVRNLEKLIIKEKPDVAHLHNIQYQLTPAIIQTLKKHGIPVIQTLHAYNIICPNAKLYTEGSPCERCRGRWFYNCLAHKCAHDSYAKSFLGMLEAYLNVSLLKRYDDVDVFIAPSNFMKEVSVRAGIAAEKIQVLHNFVDTQKFNAVDSEIGNYLLYFGRLAEEKGITMLIEAVKDLPDEKLKIVGEGPEYNNLKFKILNLKLGNRVELLGKKEGSELTKLITDAKAIVIPSLWPENMPYSLLEAMAMGKTVIVARIGGLPEMIEHGKNGFLFEAGNLESLKQELKVINQADLSIIGANARETVIKSSIEKYCDEFDKIAFNLVKVIV